MIDESDTFSVAARMTTPATADRLTSYQVADERPCVLAVVMAVYIALIVSHVVDIIPGATGFPVAKIMTLIAVLVAVSAETVTRRNRLLSFPGFRTAAYFHALVAISVLFSIWPGESFPFVFAAAPNLVAYALILKASARPADLRTLLTGLVWAALLVAVSALVSFVGGRARLRVFDPNDLAFVLVTIAPIIAGVARQARGFRRWALISLAGASVLLVLLTQSRGAAVALGSLCLASIFLPSPSRDGFGVRFKRVRPPSSIVLKRVLIVVTVGIVAWMLLPLDAKTRLSSLTHPADDYNAQDTRNGRLAIWERNIRQVASRPFGVGAGAFQMADVRAGGRFQAAHNAFVQVLVELGFVGLFLFIRLYFVAFRSLRRSALIGNDGGEPPHRVLATALRLSLFATLVAGMFLSVAYTNVIWMLFALAEATNAGPASAAGPKRPIAYA